MPNNFESNFTREVMKRVTPHVEAERVLSKNIDTQFYSGKFDPDTGTQIDIKRPTQYEAVTTADGDITGQKSSIITGKATAEVQDYITIAVDYNEANEALKMGTDQDRFFRDIAKEIVLKHETEVAEFMVKNTGLLTGTVGTGVSSWGEIAGAGALMSATGVPRGDWLYALSPYSQVALATEQRSLGVNNEVKTANDTATVAENVAGMMVKTATTLPTYTSGVGADRAGTLSANPDVTYLTAKDTYTQVLPVTAFQANLVVAAGEQVQVTGRNRLNLATRDPVLDATMSTITWTATVTETVTLDGSGAGNLTVTGPGIFEVGGAYNTVDSALVSGDVVTLLGSASTVYQPSLFWRRDAFSVAYVDIKKLHSTDTVYQGADGLTMRCSKYSDGDANKQTVRFDLRPALGVNNPLFAGQGFGTP